MTRYVKQPGAPREQRTLAVPATVRRQAMTLPAGTALLDAVREALVMHGCRSAVLTLRGGALGPFAYVMPSLPVDEMHAAFYSATFRPAGLTMLDAASLTFGTRDGAPFFHCHGLWTEGDGVKRGGHMLPEETVIAEPIKAVAYLLSGAAFEGTLDSETNFKLFEPVADGNGAAVEGNPAFAVRLLPNQDLSHALETFCLDKGITRAAVHGGVGSIIEARFADGTVAPRFATEMFITSGRIEVDAAGLAHSAIDVSLVDYAGEVFSGRLIRGDNPVLMTAEIVLEVL
ncbi:MAG: DNA-binding protein [Beijerinckiaceae bacterium]|nr:DNA-binding protein [Beijerinckiaceae bacterium]